MSSIETNATPSIRFTQPGEREATSFFGRTQIGDSPPRHVDSTPEAADVGRSHDAAGLHAPPGRSEQVTPIEPGSRLDDLIDDYKLALVHQALAQSGGNHRRAAALLGIHRSSFTRMLHRLEGARKDRLRAQPASVDV